MVRTKTIDSNFKFTIMSRIAIVEDHATVRRTLENIINSEEGLTLMGSYADGQEALVLIPLMKPDLVLMDIQLEGDLSGIDCIRMLKSDYPEILFMMCTVFDDEERIFEALCA